MHKIDIDIDQALKVIHDKYRDVSPHLAKVEMMKILLRTQNKEKMGILFRMIAAHLDRDSVTASQLMFQLEPFYLIIAMIDTDKFSRLLHTLSKEISQVLAVMFEHSILGRFMVRFRSKAKLVQLITQKIKLYKSQAEPILQDRRLLRKLLRSSQAESILAGNHLDMFENRFTEVIKTDAQHGGASSSLAQWFVYLVIVVVFFVPLTLICLLFDLLLAGKRAALTRSSVLLLRSFTRNMRTDAKVDHAFSFILHRYLSYSDGYPIVPAVLIDNPGDSLQPWDVDPQNYIGY